jgi:hypothetical protein
LKRVSLLKFETPPHGFTTKSDLVFAQPRLGPTVVAVRPTRQCLRCAKSLSPPPDLRTAKRIRISINEPQFVARDAGDEVLRIGPFNVRAQRAFSVPSYDLVRILTTFRIDPKTLAPPP